MKVAVVVFKICVSAIGCVPTLRDFVLCLANGTAGDACLICLLNAVIPR